MMRAKLQALLIRLRESAREAWPILAAKGRVLALGCWELIQVLWSGWLGVSRQLFEALKTLLQAFAMGQLAFLLVCAALVVLPLLSWTSFQIDLTGPERVGVGSSFRLLFIAPGTLGIVFALLDIPFKRAVFSIVIIVCLLVYILGFVFPNPVHTVMINPDDYRFSIPLYFYGPLLGSAFFLSGSAFAEPILDARHLLSWALRREN